MGNKSGECNAAAKVEKDFYFLLYACWLELLETMVGKKSMVTKDLARVVLGFQTINSIAFFSSSSIVIVWSLQLLFEHVIYDAF